MASTLFSFLILAMLLIIVHLHFVSSTKPISIRFTLNHRKSLYPHYNLMQHGIRDDELSNIRATYLNHLHRNKDASYDATERLRLRPAPIANYGEENAAFYYINFFVGTPPFAVTTFLDTGSSNSWITCGFCDPCAVSNRTLMFNLYQSSSRSKVPCQPFCYGRCDDERKIKINYTLCDYFQGYLRDDFNSSGILVKDKFTFGNVVVPDLMFGCGTENYIYLPGNSTGIFGLGPKYSYSVVYQLGYKFSYCIDRLGYTNIYPYNQLIIGSDARMEGMSTPLLSRGRWLYFLELETISLETTNLGSTTLDIDPSVFRFRYGSESAVVIDTGAAPTYLPFQAHKVIRAEIKSLLDKAGFTEHEFLRLWQLCYYGTVDGVEKTQFRSITLHFAGGATLILDKYMTFTQKHRKYFCLQLYQNEYDAELTIIGMLAQQTYNVGYDLENQKLYLERIMDCKLLD